MGNTKSVCRNIFKNKTNQDNDNNGRKSSTQSFNGNEMLNTEEHDQELDILRRIIEHNPELFVLNNLMMCIQFFENYDEEILTLKQKLSSTEEVKFNTYLPPYKHVLIPDILEEQAAKNVNYTYIQPSLMIPSIETIQPSRIYVVYDNIEVTEQSFSSPYSNVNGTFTYNMQLKQSKHRGYALLQRLEVNPSQNYLEHHLLSGDKKQSMTVSTVYSESNDDGENDSKSDHDNSLHTDNDVSHNKNNNKMNVSIESRKVDMMESTKCDGSFKPALMNLQHRDSSNIYGSNDECKSVASTSMSHGRINGKSGHSSQTSSAESSSSGYRSGNYTIDSDSDDISYNLTRNSTTTVIHSRRHDFGTKNIIKQFDEKHSLSDNESNSILPRQCFEIYNPRRNKKQRLTKKDKILQDVIYYDHQCDIWYLSSQKFMDYFYKLFINKLSMTMGFDLGTTRITIPNAAGYDENTNNVAVDKSYGPVIYCDKFELLQNAASASSSYQKYSQKQGMKNNRFAIIPCIWSSWPDMADEWVERPRIWPHYNTVERIKEIGCHLIPKGYSDDKDHISINNNASASSNSTLKNLEWEVTFPEAERYLETCMSYSQTRVYLMALVLHKTFVQSATIIDSYSGLTGNHIKNQLFWLIEENDKPSRWLDSRMGEALMRLLNSLYRCISQDVPYMRDYFIRDKNIFQGKIYLLRTQKQLKRIMENPIMYLLHAMQNIEYRQNFFPTLDYDLLIKILTEDIRTLMYPHLASTTLPSKSHYYVDQHSISPMNDDSYFVDKTYNQRSGGGGFWNNAKQVKPSSNISKKSLPNKTLIDTRISYDQVIEISAKCAELQEPRRLCLLLELFIKHFIKIAECCHKYGALSQKSIYIDQALRLSILLLEYSSKGLSASESNRHIKENVKIYMEKLHALKCRTNRIGNVKKHSDDLRTNSVSPPPLPPPMLPTRNATNTDSPIFSSPLKDRYKNIHDKNNNSQLSRIPDECHDGIEDYGNNNHVIKAVVHTNPLMSTETETPHVVLTTDNEDEACGIGTTYL